MAWPTTGAGSLTSGYLVTTDVTTVVWGTKDILANIGGVTTSGTTIGIVTRFSQKTLQEVVRLPNGDGLTSSRIHIVDGTQWTLTIRDDTRITVRPKIGNTVLVYDAGGLITASAGAGGTPASYIAVIVEVDYETAPKQAAEFTITVENLTLFTEAQVNLA
jgi:hypothetical protein